MIRSIRDLIVNTKILISLFDFHDSFIDGLLDRKLR